MMMMEGTTHFLHELVAHVRLFPPMLTCSVFFDERCFEAFFHEMRTVLSAWQVKTVERPIITFYFISCRWVFYILLCRILSTPSWPLVHASPPRQPSLAQLKVPPTLLITLLRPREDKRPLISKSKENAPWTSRRRRTPVIPRREKNQRFLSHTTFDRQGLRQRP